MRRGPARCSASARSTSSTASPIACGSGAVSPGSASSSATSSARRRGGASEGADLVEHVAEQIREPGEGERCLGLDTPVHVSTVPSRPRASSTPVSQSIVLPIPASPERTSARGPSSASASNASIDAKLLLPPDDRRRHFVWIVTRGGRYAYGTPRLRAGRAARRRRRPPRRAAVARARRSMSTDSLMPLRTRIVRDAAEPAERDVQVEVVADHDELGRRHAEVLHDRPHRGARRLADDDGPPPVTFASAAVSIAPRLKIGPFAPA